MPDTHTAAQAASPSNGTANGGPSKPTSGQRSSPYPSFSLQQSLELTNTIYESYGDNAYVTREQAAALIHQSASSVQSKMSTAVQYGLLALKPKVGYKVSDLFIKWKRPISDEQHKEAMLTAFRNPPLYKALIGQFDGGMLPLAGPLANLLRQNHRIFDTACDEAAQIFIDNATHLGVLGPDKHLRVNATGAPSEQSPPESRGDGGGDDGQFVPVEVMNPNPHAVDGTRIADGLKTPHSQPNAEVLNVKLKGGKTATVIMPHDVTSNDIDLLLEWVELYKKSRD